MNVGNVNDHPCYVWTRKFKTKDKTKRTPLVMMHGMGAGEIFDGIVRLFTYIFWH